MGGSAGLLAETQIGGNVSTIYTTRRTYQLNSTTPIKSKHDPNLLLVWGCVTEISSNVPIRYILRYLLVEWIQSHHMMIKNHPVTPIISCFARLPGVSACKMVSLASRFQRQLHIISLLTWSFRWGTCAKIGLLAIFQYYKKTIIYVYIIYIYISIYLSHEYPYQ